ncbi:TrmH family RNA methyltransferase [Allomuricauda sp. R78024]|uniref:TrmH family RNA methyltransferase n=1 Tax=Allomuricauda sp. R78024 TaxID=3093867 RepID=UPI0037C582E0
MVTKNQIKLVVSLQQKKYRTQHGLFVVEGAKTTREILKAGLKPFKLFIDEPQKIEDFIEAEVISKSELKQMSSLSNPNGVLGVFYMPDTKKPDNTDWLVGLDAVRDPGNLGTIIRLCDWFGVKHLICSMDTVDCYNPKVLQATMGSITRVNVVYTDLLEYLKKSSLSIFGTFMNGDTVYQKELPEAGIMIMGNEANGISKEICDVVTEKIAIPQFGSKTTESLNVATATAILLNEIRRG